MSGIFWGGWSSKKVGSMYERNIQKVGFHVWKKQPNHLNSPKDSQVYWGVTFDLHTVPAFEYSQIHPELADKADMADSLLHHGTHESAWRDGFYANKNLRKSSYHVWKTVFSPS